MEEMNKAYATFEERDRIASLGGGVDKIEKQHESGKMTARERIDMLLDKGTFVELDKLMVHRCTNYGMDKNKIPGDGIVSGYGKVDGRQVFVYAYDFTVYGGSLSASNAKKIVKVQQLALKNGAPIIALNDSGGARIQEGIESLSGYADIFYQNENQSAGDLGKLQGQLRPAIDRYEVLEVEKQDIFKSTLASFNRVYAYITQVCRLFDKDIHRFSIYSKFLYTMLPKGHGGEKINIDDKVLLEYYKLEKDFEGPIELESTEGGYTPISGDSGHREPKKDPLTVIIDKINEKYGTHFTEMDKVLVQMENDYANQEKWQSYAKNNDRATFMLLFEKDFPNMAADRYEQNDQFFRKLFDDPDMMRQVMETVGSVLYERLKKKYIFDPKSGVIEEATPETYVEDTYLTKK